ncbi:MAG: zinc ribbon domain-containing protein [Patescibacteria group bacterium]|nr:zinc ribbon domain-containing protein [Patescibacteria group bacterium]
MRDFFAAFFNRPALWLLGLGGMVGVDFLMVQYNAHMYGKPAEPLAWYGFFGAVLAPLGVGITDGWGQAATLGTSLGFLLVLGCLALLLALMAFWTKQRSGAFFGVTPVALYLLAATIFMETQLSAQFPGSQIAIWPAFGKGLGALLLAMAAVQIFLALVRIPDMGNEWPGFTDQEVYRPRVADEPSAMLPRGATTMYHHQPGGNGQGNGGRGTMYQPPSAAQQLTGKATYCWNCGSGQFYTEHGERKCRHCKSMVDNRPAGDICPACGAELVGAPLTPKHCGNCGRDREARQMAAKMGMEEYA